jgi:DNA ligase-1
MQLEALARLSRLVGETRSRLGKIDKLAELLRQLTSEEIPIGVAFLCGELPRGRIGIGPAALREASAAPSAPSPSLTIADVDRALFEIASISGPGSASERAHHLRALFSRATKEERDFLFRLLLGEVRQGALEGLMVEAIARAASLPLAAVRRAFMMESDLGAVARAALVEGDAGLARFRVRLFRPILPMLAQTAEDVGEVLKRMGSAAFEHKLDGARVQAHKSGSEVRLFTRGLNEVTESAPEISERVRGVPAREVILDGEVLALRSDGKPQPFQTTMRRFGRKLDVEAMRRELPLTPFFFDCLYLDGEPLIDRPAAERFTALSLAAPPELLVPRRVTADAAEAEAFYREAVAAGHEGVMAKLLEAPYEAGGRGLSWLKLKRAHTLDLVVLAAEWGHGRRRGFLSNLHLGARDPASGSFVMLGKTFKGMTDEMLAWQTGRLLELESARDGGTVYVRPELVVEIAVSDIQASPHYPAGMALRLARVKRYRPDKSAAEADTLDAVRALLPA